MANISNIINVSLTPESELAARQNFNAVAIITSQQDGSLSSSNRYELYSDASSVATDFGTSSEMNQHAKAFFGTQPNPINAGGVLVAGYWRASEETVAATAAVLEGGQVSSATVIEQLQQISDGSFDIDIDGGTESLTAMDFQTVTSMSDVIDTLNSNLTGGTASFSNQKVLITSDTTGSTSEITVVSEGVVGTFVGNILALADGTGATATQGAAADTLSAETKEEAITALKAAVGFKGAIFIDEPTDDEAETLAEWAQANDTLVYDVFDDDSNLEVATTNPVWSIKLSGYTNYRMLYSKAGNRKLGTSYMARVHTVNFGAKNSALTMHLKTLNATAESYTQTEIDKAKAVGLDIYTTSKNTPIVLTSGANDFVDNRYNILAFVDAVQTDLFNLLKQTSTKIPQTISGVNQLLDQAEKTTLGFVRSEVFAPGVWTSPDYFGNRETFERNIERNGFYWLAGRLADQSQADRQARKSPVIQGAVKFAGATHSAEIVINVNL